MGRSSDAAPTTRTDEHSHEIHFVVVAAAFVAVSAAFAVVVISAAAGAAAVWLRTEQRASHVGG